VVPGAAGRTAANIVANRSLYRLACTIFMIELWHRWSCRSCSATYYTPLILLSGAPYLSAMGPAQLATLSLAFIMINNQGAAIALISFRFETLLRGWLIFRSEFLPRTLGVLSIVVGLGWLTFLWPPVGSRGFMAVALFAIGGVIATTGWLIIRGVDEEKWTGRAALAPTSIRN
jgi:hypothetical protein